MRKQAIVQRVCVTLSVCLLLLSGISQAKTSLTIWGLNNPATTAWDDIFARYMNLHLDIETQYTMIPWGPEKFMVSFAAGAAPDIVIPGEWWRQYARHNMITPAPSYVADTVRRYFLPPAVELSGFEGKIWGMPVNLSYNILGYSKCKFEEVGLRPSAPTTWTDWTQYARKLTKCDGENRITQAGLDVHHSDLSLWMLVLPFTNGGPALPDDLQYDYGNDAFRESLELIRKMAVEYRVDELRSGWSPTLPNGKAAMSFARPNAIRPGKFPLDWNCIDAAPFPRGKGERATVYWGSLITVSSSSAHQAEAWRLVEFMANKENSSLFADSMGTIVPRRDARSEITGDARDSVLEVANYAFVTTPGHSAWVDTRAVIKKYATQVVRNEISVETAVDLMNREARILLEPSKD